MRHIEWEINHIVQTEEASSMEDTTCTIESSHTVYVKLNTCKVMLQESIVKSASLILLRSQLKLAYEQQREKTQLFFDKPCVNDRQHPG